MGLTCALYATVIILSSCLKNKNKNVITAFVVSTNLYATDNISYLYGTEKVQFIFEF